MNYTFNGKKSTFQNDTAEATILFKKVDESSVAIDVTMKHYATDTIATYQKDIVLKEDGTIHHYPIKNYEVEGKIVGKNNTTKKYFTHILGEEGYQEFRKKFLKEYALRKEMELSCIL
ncbi:hypothetical protein [Oceanobacillus halophilus]|uniref:Uncharacterized protein n=1 Tax=Oceanobacillus halophilus TaxID=930130 RepID=A0A495A3N2_9BACI|nr:hypothetical protein [Oceanobacillus halophilus]RKQ33969.1 hypothetical protein D8M06_09105 [Oceanobacillus halophilus]